MTQVTIRMRTATEGHVDIVGHAGDSLICAAVSTLTAAVLNTIGEAAQNVIYEPGNVQFDVRFTDGLQMGAFNVLVEAFEMLAESFSEGVGVTLMSSNDVE